MSPIAQMQVWVAGVDACPSGWVLVLLEHLVDRPNEVRRLAPVLVPATVSAPSANGEVAR